jgi:5'-3' exonuclease
MVQRLRQLNERLIMKLGRHTLLIDGNYFLHSRLFVLPRKKNERLLESEESKSQLMRKLCIDFASEVRKMNPFVDQIVVAIDSKSWRKDLFPDANYKGTRTHDDSVDWNAVFQVYTEFQQILSRKGVIIHQINGAEADDVLFGWSTQLNNEGSNCIVWTGDRDLIQLVNYNEATDAYTLWYYNSKRRLIAFEGFEEVLNREETSDFSNEDLLFNMSQGLSVSGLAKKELRSWIDKNKVAIEEVNCDDFIFTKILQGDKSDNIAAVVCWTKHSKSGKTLNYSITEKQADKILEQYKKEEGNFTIDLFFNKTQVDKIVDIIYRVAGQSDPQEIKMRFNQNLDLMLLHYNTIPDPIQKDIYKNVENDFNNSTDLGKLSKMEIILEGTGWIEKKTATPSGYDPFAGLEIPETKQQKVDTNPKGLF